MKAVQNLVYAFTGVNIFAKATASSMKSAAGSAKETNKALAGFDEINNINQSTGSGSSGGSISPSLDLSSLENASNTILDAIKNGDWYEVGGLVADKLNTALANIPWEKIQNTASSIGTGLAQTLNGFIAKTDWEQVGNTFAQGLNTVIYFGYSFVTTFDWQQFGTAIGDSINGFFSNVDWATAGQTLSEGIKGAFTTIYTALEEIDWQGIARNIEEFIKNIDWGGVIYAIIRGISSGLMGLGVLIGTWIADAIQEAKQYFQEKIEECGGNIVGGILKGIIDGIVGIGQWIYDNMIKPIIDSFCSLLGIHSPSTVFEGFGKNIVEGLLNGIKSLIDKVKEKWTEIKTNATNTFNNIKTKVVEIFNNIKTKASEIWTNIKSGITNKVTEIKNGITNKFKEAYNNITSTFERIGNFFSNIWNNIRNTFSNLGTSIGNAISGAVKAGINNVIRLIQNTINRAINMINGAIGVINVIPGVNISKLSQLRLPQLAVGTNYVPEDQLAYIHEGEAVIPKKFNSQEYFGSGNEETNGLLERVIEAIENIEINPYTTIKDVGKTAVNYINSRNRQLGGSVIA